MPKLNLREALSLVAVFGRLEQRALMLLFCFEEPRSKYDVVRLTSKLPKNYCIPRASLYRKVDELYDAGFLDEDVSRTRPFVRGPLKAKVRYYELSSKGLILDVIFRYVVYYAMKPLGREWKETTKESIEYFENSSLWAIVIDSLRWHRDMRFDLGRAKIDYCYIFLTAMISKFDRLNDVKDESLRRLLGELKARIGDYSKKQLRVELRGSIGPPVAKLSGRTRES